MPQKKRLTKRDEELELMKHEPMETLSDFDVYELNSRRLRFRKYPWPFWFIGFSFLAGVLLIVHLEMTG
jgi:hypothetical protein